MELSPLQLWELEAEALLRLAQADRVERPMDIVADSTRTIPKEHAEAIISELTMIRDLIAGAPRAQIVKIDECIALLGRLSQK